MFDINKEVFLKKYKEKFGKLNNSQVEGLSELIDNLNKDPNITNYKQACYLLATTKHETGDTYKPIKEWGLGRGLEYGKPDKVTGKTYYGRGYCQCTWKTNYQKFSTILNIDLVSNPDLALEPDVAYKIISIGMVKGLFTGKKLSNYITDNICNYKEARRIINGMDCTDKIANYAISFQSILS